MKPLISDIKKKLEKLVSIVFSIVLVQPANQLSRNFGFDQILLHILRWLRTTMAMRPRLFLCVPNFFQQSRRRFLPFFGPLLRLRTSEKDYLEFDLFVSVGIVVLLVSPPL